MRVKNLISGGILALVASLGPARAADTILHTFTDTTTDGANPYGSLSLSGSTLYGMTSAGGNTGSGGAGTIFSVNTDGTGFNLLHSFTFSSSDGRDPQGSLVLSGSTLYGMSFGGGANTVGTIFSINTNGTGYSTLYNFGTTVSDGGSPKGSLTLSGSKLYGVTKGGGSGGSGTIFSMNTNGTGFSVLHGFSGSASDGGDAAGSLTLVASKLYGMSYLGGSSNDGTLFSINTDGTGFSLLHSFTDGAADGGNPAASLTLVGSKLYGMTPNGGSTGNGAIFSINPDGTGFSLLHSFSTSGNGGYWPEGSLTLIGTKLYGMTSQSGTSVAGSLFSMNTDGTGFSVLQSFPTGAADGQIPDGDLTVSADALTLYGMTSHGGTAGYGVVFSASAAPEPAGAALFSLGTITLLISRRRRG